MLIHTGPKTIKTQRLILRKFISEDAKAAFANWAGDEKVQNDYGEPVYKTEEETKELLNKYIDRYQSGDSYRWAIDIADGEKCVGQIAYFIVDSNNMFCEIEYCIGERFQNKGFITEAVKAVTKYGFESVGFNRIQVSCRSVNTPSKRVIEKCDFTYEGVLREFFNHLGEFQDREYYSILKREWEVDNEHF